MRARRTRPDSLKHLAPAKGAADLDSHDLDSLERLDGGYQLQADSLERLAGGQDGGGQEPGGQAGGREGRATGPIGTEGPQPKFIF